MDGHHRVPVLLTAIRLKKAEADVPLPPQALNTVSGGKLGVFYKTLVPVHMVLYHVHSRL